MLSLRMLIRTWRGGELSLMLSSLVLAVAVVTSVSLLAERIEKALVQESSSFLAADLLVRSSKEAPFLWQEEAQRKNIVTAKTMGFASVVFFKNDLHLASIKAVQTNYPLRGQLKRSKTAFTRDESLIETVDFGPSAGEVWVDARLLPLLNIKLGDKIELGDASFKVSHILVEEPDGSSYSFVGARVLMNYADIPQTGVVQPGSRVTYRFLMASNNPRDLDAYKAWLEPQLDVHDRLITPDQAQASISDTMDKGRRFLLLAGSIGVVLASIALALASHHFAGGQIKQVALLKSWGISASRVRSLYFQQSIWMGVLGSIVGLAIGFIFHHSLLFFVQEWLPNSLPSAGLRSWIIGLATGLICLAGFTMPALWHLPTQSPLAVLRQDIPSKPLSLAVRVLLGVSAIASLLLWYSGSVLVSLAILSGFAITSLASVVAGLALLRTGMRYGQRMGSIWRLALSNLWRRRSQSLIQMIGFSGAIALLMIMVVVRTSLIDQWRFQLAEDAPNHFLVNVAPYELDGVRDLVNGNQLETAGWFAMVRGRMVEINGEPISDDQKDGHESFRRELNLSWTSELPDGNTVAQGDWWDGIDLTRFGADRNNGSAIAPVSLEDKLAGELGLNLGDRITFSVGGLIFEAEMIGTRSLNWDNMTPNFYFLFPEGMLEEYPRTSMTSVYIPPDKKLLINDILKSYPTVQVLELDKIIDRIRAIVSQVTRGLEVMTLLILGCGILVLFAAVSLSMSERLQESAILRTLGSSRRLILGIQLIEFSTLGIMAGLLATAGAEFSVFMLQRFMFDMSFSMHPWLWVTGPVIGGFLVGSLGVGYSWKAVVQPPLEVLRSI